MPNTDSRYDGDSWDLTASVGATATAVAAARAMASQGPDGLLDDRFADPLVRAVGLSPFVDLLNPDRVLDDPVLNRRTMIEQITVRTRFFDDFFSAATASGIRQAVVLAAGLDTRAYRLPWPAGTAVFELDQPRVIAFKTRTLTGLGAEPTAQRRTVAVDLRDDWPTALTAAGFDSGAPTAWIAEGLLIYLPSDAQDALLDHVTALSAPGSRVATEQMDVSTLPEGWADELAERSRRIGADLNLAELFYVGERNNPADYLGGLGWRTEVLTTEAAYAAQGFDLPDEDWAGSTGRGSGYLTATLTGG